MSKLETEIGRMISQKWDVAMNSKSGHFIVNCHLGRNRKFEAKSVHPLFSCSFVNVDERRAAGSKEESYSAEWKIFHGRRTAKWLRRTRDFCYYILLKCRGLIKCKASCRFFNPVFLLLQLQFWARRMRLATNIRVFSPALLSHKYTMLKISHSSFSDLSTLVRSRLVEDGFLK